MILSLIFLIATSGYEGRAVENQTNPEDIGQVLDSTYSQSDYYRDKLEKYLERIHNKDKVIFVLESFLVLSKIFLLVGITTGVIAINFALNGSPLTISIVSLVGLVLLGLIFWKLFQLLPEKYRQSDVLIRFNPPYDLDYVKSRKTSTVSSSELENPGDESGQDDIDP